MLSNDFYGDRFRWFTGVVKDIGDDRARVRVRIFGIHHTEDLTRISNGDLPWALVLFPTTGGQTSGGNVSHGLKVGTWVVGFFVDGEDSQQPIVIGVINGGPGSVNNSPQDPVENTTTSTNPTNTSTPQNNPGVASSSDTPSTQLSGSDNANKAYNFFWEKVTSENSFSGDKKCIVAAIVGNLLVESGDGLNPQAYNPNDLGQSSYGIAQWRAGKYDRASPMFRFCGSSANMTPPNLPPLEKQLDFIWHEFHSTERSAYNKILTATNIQDAVVGIISYERDESYKGKNGVDTTNRTYIRKLTKARQVLSSFSYSGGAV